MYVCMYAEDLTTPEYRWPGFCVSTHAADPWVTKFLLCAVKGRNSMYVCMYVCVYVDISILYIYTYYI